MAAILSRPAGVLLLTLLAAGCASPRPGPHDQVVVERLAPGSVARLGLHPPDLLTYEVTDTSKDRSFHVLVSKDGRSPAVMERLRAELAAARLIYRGKSHIPPRFVVIVTGPGQSPLRAEVPETAFTQQQRLQDWLRLFEAAWNRNEVPRVLPPAGPEDLIIRLELFGRGTERSDQMEGARPSE